MQRGEIWWVDFDHSHGGEIKKTRPAIILSNDASNASLNRIQIIPLTSNAGRLYPSEAEIMTHGKKSKAMADQMTTATKERFREMIGRISNDEMKAVERAIKIQLGLKI